MVNLTSIWKRPRPRLGISVKLTLPAVLICGVTAILLGSSCFSVFTGALHEAMIEKSRLVARTLATDLRAPMLLGEYPQMKRLLGTASRVDADLSYATVLATNGDLLARADRTAGQTFIGPAPSVVTLPGAAVHKKHLGAGETAVRETKNRNIFEVVSPIDLDGVRAGEVVVGFSRDRVEARLKSASDLLLGISAASVVLSVLIYFVLVKNSVLVPVDQIVRTAGLIAHGDIPDAASTQLSDELGDLQRSMSLMVTYLKEMAATADAIASGDFTVKVEPLSNDDVFGNSFKKMIESLKVQTNELITREAEAAKLAAIVECSDEAIIGMELDGKIISWNRGANKLFGYMSQEIVGKSVSVLFKDESSLVQLFGLMLTMAQGENVENVEMIPVRKDGPSIDVELTISPVLVAADGIPYISLIARDVTHKKTVEQRMREFYSVVSHELRTPLTSIRGALGLIADGIIPVSSGEAMDLIQMAKTSCVRLNRLVNDILDIRKIEEGKLDLNFEVVPVQELVARSIDDMSGLAAEQDVKVIPGTMAHLQIRADKDRIVQVLANLLSNALKYSNPGSAVVVSATARDGVNIRISVTDFGAGIPEELQGKLFSKFQQADSSDTRAREGSGLGLAISKAIVEQHSGKIGMVSSSGHGSTFWFDLPLHMEDASANDDPTLTLCGDAA